MALFTARLTRTEQDRLKAIAEREGVTMTELLRRWIDQHEQPPMTITAPPLSERAQREIEEDGPAFAEATKDMLANLPDYATDAKVVAPPFLVAPNDDCGPCGHEWHPNEAPGCQFITERRGRKVIRCGCTQYGWEQTMEF